MCLLVNKFLCCISLDVGAKVIGIWSTDYTCYRQVRKVAFTEKNVARNSLSCAAICVLYGTSAAKPRSVPLSRLVFYWCMAAVALLQMLFASLLTYGAFKNKPRLMWPWTILAWCQSAALVVLTVTGMVVLVWHSDSDGAGEFSTVISIYFVYALVQYYLATTVHSRRQEILRQDHSDSAKRLMRTDTIPNHYV